MTLPAQVKIGYRTYKIVDWDARSSASRDALGECDHWNGEIRVSRLLGPAKAANTLLHEILHALWYVYSVEDGDKEERCVTTVANALCGVWVDNPEVFEWLNDSLTKGEVG